MAAAEVNVIDLVAQAHVNADAEAERIRLEIQEVESDIAEDIEITISILDRNTGIRSKVKADAP